MTYKILYIEDNAKESRESDLRKLGYTVISHDPSSDLSKILDKIDKSIDAIILDYRLTEGEQNACFDAPTIASTMRTKHSKDNFDIPIILMSNEDTIIDYYNDFSNQNLFDFVLTKESFVRDGKTFGIKLKSFIDSYKSIIENDFNIIKILKSEGNKLHPKIHRELSELKYKKEHTNAVFEYSSFIYHQIINSTGILIDKSILSSRLGVQLDNPEGIELIKLLEAYCYHGAFSDIKELWWMGEIENWWKEVISEKIPLRRLNAEERTELIKSKTGIDNLLTLEKTKQSHSTNFWTVCKYSNEPIDPFDGVELIQNLHSWQEKEYLSIDSALLNKEEYLNKISKIDKKVIRELGTKLNDNA